MMIIRSRDNPHTLIHTRRITIEREKQETTGVLMFFQKGASQTFGPPKKTRCHSQFGHLLPPFPSAPCYHPPLARPAGDIISLSQRLSTYSPFLPAQPTARVRSPSV